MPAIILGTTRTGKTVTIDSVYERTDGFMFLSDSKKQEIMEWTTEDHADAATLHEEQRRHFISKVGKVTGRGSESERADREAKYMASKAHERANWHRKHSGQG